MPRFFSCYLYQQKIKNNLNAQYKINLLNKLWYIYPMRYYIEELCSFFLKNKKDVIYGNHVSECICVPVYV